MSVTYSTKVWWCTSLGRFWSKPCGEAWWTSTTSSPRARRHPNIIELRGHIKACHGETTTKLEYHVPHLDECPEPGDRVVVVVRSAFILDECCRPVDGLNVGGRVPYRPNEKHHPESPEPIEPCRHCQVPPWGYAPWSSAMGQAAALSRVGFM